MDQEPIVPNPPRLEDVIAQAAERFAYEIIDTLRSSKIADMNALAAAKPGAEAAATVPEPAAQIDPPTEVPAEPEKPVKKKRNWPKCTVEGCDANFYAPSGSPRLCYAHHIEGGGEASPLVRAQQKKKAAAKPAKAKVAKAEAPAVEAEPTPVAVEAAPEPAPEKKKRNWPKCSAEGCEKNAWGPSGQAKLCYQHHREAGGAASPLLGKKKAKAAAPQAKPVTEIVEPDSILDPEPPVEAPKAEPEAEAKVQVKPKKKRAWPKCTAEGCSKNVYMPSGAAKLCYQHHQEAGGAASTLLGKKKKKAPKAEAPKAAEAVQPDSLLDPEPATTAEPPEPAPSPKPPKKKRAWPICTAEGCGKNVYMPSGSAKLCYKHHVEAGGKASPLVAHNRAKKKEPEPEPEPEKPARKTILRKKP